MYKTDVPFPAAHLAPATKSVKDGVELFAGEGVGVEEGVAVGEGVGLGEGEAVGEGSKSRVMPKVNSNSAAGAVLETESHASRFFTPGSIA